MLSEKAKGKQRAVVADPTPEPVIPRALIIRFNSEGISDLGLELNPSESTVRAVKRQIRDARPDLEDRILRVIHSGRMLADTTDLLPLLNAEDRRRAGDEPPQATTTWLHCSVGPKLEDGQEDEGRAQSGQLQPARGFDRLAGAGFSETDIANFRRQFHSQSASNYLDTADFDTDEQYAEHARAMEEQWIDSLDNTAGGAPSLTSGGGASTPASLLQGICVGFFFPLIPFFFMRNPKDAVFWDDGTEYESTGSSVVFSRRMQMGLVFGFILNIVFGIWRIILHD